MVPRVYPDSTIVCIGSGPSLTASDLALVYDAVQSGGVTALVINSTYTLVPWASVLFAADANWWARHPVALTLPALKFAFPPTKIEGVTTLEWTRGVGLDGRPDRLRSGGHSGYAAINLAVHLGAARVALLGYDMAETPDCRHHVAGCDHPDGSHINYQYHRAVYRTLLRPMAALGIDLVNCSRRTAIPDVPRASLESVLLKVAA